MNFATSLLIDLIIYKIHSSIFKNHKFNKQNKSADDKWIRLNILNCWFNKEMYLNLFSILYFIVLYFLLSLIFLAFIIINYFAFLKNIFKTKHLPRNLATSQPSCQNLSVCLLDTLQSFTFAEGSCRCWPIFHRRVCWSHRWRWRSRGWWWRWPTGYRTRPGRRRLREREGGWGQGAWTANRGGEWWDSNCGIFVKIIKIII